MRSMVFDADGVVCTGGSFSVHLEREHGIPAAALAAFFRGPFRECLAGRSDLVRELEPVLPEIGWKGSVSSFLEFWFARENVVDAQLLERIARLRAGGMRCVLGTNQERHRLAFMRSAMGFERIFDRVFASCELGVAKPEPEFFARVVELLRCRPGDVTLIDDAEGNVAAARACGWNAVHYRGLADVPRS